MKNRAPDFGAQRRARVHAGVAAERAASLFQMEREQGEPKWANVKFPPIDYQNIVYYSAPKQKPSLDSLNQVIRSC